MCCYGCPHDAGKEVKGESERGRLKAGKVEGERQEKQKVRGLDG